MRGSWSDGEGKEQRIVPATHKESHSVMSVSKNTQNKPELLRQTLKRQDLAE